MRFLPNEMFSQFNPEWEPMLTYTASLHEKSIHPPMPPFSEPWEEIGPGYCVGGAFGHWDLIHQSLDTLPADPPHALAQLRNYLGFQLQDGFLPGTIYVDTANRNIRPTLVAGHPPVWPFLVDDYCFLTKSDTLIREAYRPLVLQIGWFEQHRAADGGGFFYLDILNHLWESGVDEGIRFDEPVMGRPACVDASAHLYKLYEAATRWASHVGEDPAPWATKASTLREFITTHLFSPKTGFFHDQFSVGKAQPPLAIEGIWPLVTGAAEPEQANRVIDENLLNEERFLSQHPLCTVGRCDPRFELRMWRGPAWNSITYWAARGCLLYGRSDAAKLLLERALDSSARLFGETGTIWEFYHPDGASPLTLARKPDTSRNAPCRDYLGHNPVIAMAMLWNSIV